MNRDAESWLTELGLGKYSGVFAENDVDMEALPYLTEADLKEMGVSLGHRRRLLAAIEGLDAARQPGGAGEPAEDAHEDPRPRAGEPSVRHATERRNISVLFSDLVGSTELAGSTDPEILRNILRRYQDTAAGAVTRYGGHVAKYLGDGLVVYFGWPTAYEDHAERAVRSGLEIIRAVGQIRPDEGAPLQVRVGVASGTVIIGDLVGANTMEVGAITGQTPNLASRLQAEGRPNTLTISEQTRDLLGAAFDLSPPVQKRLKGFTEPQTFLEVTGERRVASRFEAVHGKPTGPMVGRHHENGLLAEAWRRAGQNRGAVVLLSGEAGIGKSRLTENLIGTVLDGGADVWRMQCSPYFSTSAFHPFTELLARLAGIDPDDDDDVRLAKLTAMLATAENPSARARLEGAAALLAPGTETAKDFLKLPPQEQKETSFRFLAGEVVGQCAGRPLLLVIEDAHWIDPSTLEALERIVATSADLPLMILVTHRPEWGCDWAGHYPNVTSLRLDRLDRDQIAELIAGVMGSPPEADLVTQIAERSDGIPLFVEEMSRAASESGGLGLQGVPPTLQGTLLARLDRLSAEARQTAQVASVIGRDFQPDVLRAAMGFSTSALQSALVELRRAGLVFESGLTTGVFAFRHALMQDAAYTSMISETRRTYHLATARALLEVRGLEAGREPELVAKHFEEAADHDNAFRYWKLATEKALGRAAGLEAIEHAKSLIKAAGQAGENPLEMELTAEILYGRCVENVGRLQEALRLLRRTAERAFQEGCFDLFAEAAHRFADCALMADSAIEIASELCARAVQSPALSDQNMRSRLLSQMARLQMLLGDFESSADYSRKASELAEGLGDKKAQFSLLMTRFTVPVVAREPAEISAWRERLQKMYDLAADLDDHDQGRERTIGIYVSAEMGDRDRMEESLERLAEVGEARQHMHLQWVERHGRAMKAILDGDFATAERFSQEGLRIGRQTHGAHVEGVYGVQMFTIRREQSRLQEVAPVFRQLLDDNPEEASWKPGFALIAAELGFADAARRMLDEIAEEGFRLPLDAMYSITLGYLAEIAVAVGSLDHAPRLYGLLEPYRDITITAGVTTVCAGAAARRLGILATLLGDWSLAEEHFETALEIDERMRAVPWKAHSQCDFAAMLTRRGRASDRSRAEALQKEAIEAALRFDMSALQAKVRGPVQ